MRVEEAQLEVARTPAADGVVVRSAWQKHVLTFLMVFGPGLIVWRQTTTLEQSLPICRPVVSMACICSGCW